MRTHADVRGEQILEEPTVAEAERATSLLECVERVLALRASYLRETTRVSIARRDRSTVAAGATVAEEIISLALLDTTGMFASASPDNHLQCSVDRDDNVVVFELVATGMLCGGPDIWHIGAVICASRVSALGGVFLVDGSRSDARVTRISFPVAS